MAVINHVHDTVKIPTLPRMPAFSWWAWQPCLQPLLDIICAVANFYCMSTQWPSHDTSCLCFLEWSVCISNVHLTSQLRFQCLFLCNFNLVCHNLQYWHLLVIVLDRIWPHVCHVFLSKLRVRKLCRALVQLRRNWTLIRSVLINQVNFSLCVHTAPNCGSLSNVVCSFRV